MKTNQYTYTFLNKYGSNGKITVLFTDGRKANYTSAIINLLVTDPVVDTITETATGNILFYR